MKSRREGDKPTIFAEGGIDTIRAPQFADGIEQVLDDGVKDVTLDFSRAAYISSTGLRVLLAAQKVMNKQGTMIIHNANSDLMDIFEVTGFLDVLCIE
jgi:anti-sigma B factor antagonist